MPKIFPFYWKSRIRLLLAREDNDIKTNRDASPFFFCLLLASFSLSDTPWVVFEAFAMLKTGLLEN